MTVIVGLVDETGVTLGADRGLSAGNCQVELGGKLLHRLGAHGGGWLLGVAGSPVMSRWFLGLSAEQLPLCPDRGDLEQLADGWMTWCRHRELVAHEDGEVFVPSHALLATPLGELWLLQRNTTLLPIPRYAAIGMGDSFALGALAAFDDFWDTLPPADFTGPELVRRAVAAAIRHSPWCGGSPEVRHLPTE